MKRQKSVRRSEDGSAKENEDPNILQAPLRRKKAFCVTDGPFPPNDADARRSDMLTQCRHCKWYNLFWHSNFNAVKRDHATKLLVPDIRPPSCLDWCQYCGRIASVKDLEKQLAVLPSETDFEGLTAIGTKKIHFRILSHDPRKIDDFCENWESDDNLIFNQADIQEETFLHRIGRRPLLENILKSIPILEEDKIPSNGIVRVRYPMQTPHRVKVSADETYAILIDSRNDKHLLKELLCFGISTSKGSERFYHGGINNFMTGSLDASFNKDTGKGEFDLTLYAKSGAFVDYRTHVQLDGDASVARVLALFFGAAPFRAKDLTTAEAKVTTFAQRESRISTWTTVPIEPWKITTAMILEACPEEKRAVEEHNKFVSERLSSRAFTSSTGDDFGGGVCVDEFSFSGTLKRFFSDTLMEDTYAVSNSRYSGEMLTWPMRGLGIVGHHRNMDVPSSGRHIISSIKKICSYVSEEDIPLMRENVVDNMFKVYDRTKNISGLMQQLENLDYPPAPTPKGLTVELFDYQLQALNWAIHHENIEGGIQSYFWTKLPSTDETNQDLYFCPILDMFSRQPPKRVRGGFISLEMGLGKTIVSLALILQNPAPESSISGTTLSCETEIDGWTSISSDDEEKNEEKERCLQSYVLSRGTLVVVSVSLVGQWVEEAKSKLQFPGLIYSYYGSGRVTDPIKLAENAIVVTTYNTLASDASRCSDGGPLQKIRWWRVICDESHTIRNETSMSRSLLKIVAENRWAVTGTPINTSVRDLKNQLKFIGIQHVEKKFRRFEPLWTSHTQEYSSYYGRNCTACRHSPFGSFLFLMRGLIIRHSISMKHTSDGSDLVPLPKKTERIINITFSDEERVQYQKLEDRALSVYKLIRRNLSSVASHNLFLLEMLRPLRVACSGGCLQELKADEKLKRQFTEPPYTMTSSYDQDCCCICMENYDQPVATKCNPIPHIFCSDCIEGVLGVADNARGSCPLCRQEVKYKDLRRAVFPSLVLDGVIEVEIAEDEKPKFIFQSKLEVLVKELRSIRDKEPNAKSLIFSQFGSTLEWFQEEFPKYGFKYETLNGSMTMQQRAKALKNFQTDPETTIFLLSMKAGAVGINLTQANRVFLVEPALNPALEAQAIGRVHRLGQKHEVEIVRLTVENSIETRIRRKQRQTGMNANLQEAPAVGQTDFPRNGAGFAQRANSHTYEIFRGEEPRSNTNEGMPPAADPDNDVSMTSNSSHNNEQDIATAVVGNLQNDKSLLKVEQFDELFGFMHGINGQGRWR